MVAPSPVGYTLASLRALREFPDWGRETRRLYFLLSISPRAIRCRF
jgi:hypothetical protein